ncbi:PD-(D/E)XK nuclease-like domain-containing protein [Micromonospora sp. RTGN7]|uniref:PD-(D/E)XK nuclease-like domain-containing protein n=1 Tax=Micromonospora sp. RTGN7 TaxID=3016526 RepID=UPI0029FF084F|nr:PD-(D/E)XK nuclease-like domain-containing protein [Micromonospora sp. RTGN7]
MTTTEVLVITEPGIYPDMTDATYHADPVPAGSLSSSGARKLLTTCPARYDYDRRHPPAPSKAFDVGHAAHQMILGTGPHLEVVPGDRWDTKAAKATVAEIREAGGVPLKQAEHDAVQAMADAVHAHPLANALLSDGQPEQSLFWPDDRTGIWRRARPDFLRGDAIVDLKTCESADEEHIRKAIGRYGYHAQGDFYREAVRALLGQDLPFLFVFVEKSPPHLIHVVQLDADALAAGRWVNDQALDVFAECTRTGDWPGYPADITTISLPPWATRTEEFTR